MARRTKEEALATRHAILDAAERVFQQRGVARTSLHEIAAAAGVTRGAVYWHFDDKVDLFNAMMDRACLPIEETAVDPASVPPERALATLRAHLRSVFELAAHDERARRVFEIATQKVEYTDELTAVRERHLQGRAEHMAHLAQLLRAAQQAGDVHASHRPEAVAAGLHAIVDGVLRQWLLSPDSCDLLAFGMHTVDVHLAGVRAAARQFA